MQKSASYSGMILRGPSWGAGGLNNLFTTVDEEELNLKDTIKENNDSVGSIINSSFSSLGSSLRVMVDNAIDSLKNNVDSELVAQPNQEESLRDNAVKVERNARFAQISMMGDEEFRQFKKEMQATGMVTSNAIIQLISKSIGRRASMDLQHRHHHRAASMGMPQHHHRSAATLEPRLVFVLWGQY
jgi:hypothetical protein